MEFQTTPINIEKSFNSPPLKYSFIDADISVDPYLLHPNGIPCIEFFDEDSKVYRCDLTGVRIEYAIKNNDNFHITLFFKNGKLTFDDIDGEMLSTLESYINKRTNVVGSGIIVSDDQVCTYRQSLENEIKIDKKETKFIANILVLFVITFFMPILISLALFDLKTILNSKFSLIFLLCNLCVFVWFVGYALHSDIYDYDKYKNKYYNGVM